MEDSIRLQTNYKRKTCVKSYEGVLTMKESFVDFLLRGLFGFWGGG